MNNQGNIINPYPGIRSFEIGEHKLFFGREKQSTELHSILLKTRFVAVTGASGSGKSSLIKAGVIPLLIQKNENWDYVVFRPGEAPLENLAKAMHKILDKQNELPENETTLLDTLYNLKDNNLANLLLEKKYSKKLFIYIDQFEEVFRFAIKTDNQKEKEDAHLFINILINTITSRKAEIYSVITLRTDFLSDCTFFSGLPELINAGNYLIPQITPSQKKRVILGPIEASNTPVAADFETLILEDVEKYNVSLPVLQHALMRTWEHWYNQGGITELNIEHYNEIGKVTEALSFHAENIYETIASEKGKKITEKVFKALTHLGEDRRGTRQPTKLSEICRITRFSEQEIVPILNKFRSSENSFFVPVSSVRLTSDSIIDISHESIMRVWKRLVKWVDEETKSAQLYIRLSKSAELYQAEKTGVLVNPDLQLALKWIEDENPNEDWALRYDVAYARTIAYIDYSKRVAANLLVAKETKQKKGLARARFVSVFLGVASVISILFLIIALTLQFKAKDSEKKAKDKETAALAEKKIANQKKKEALAHKSIADQQKFIADQERILANEQKIYAIKQKGIAINEKEKAVKARTEAEEAKEQAIQLKKEAIDAKNKAINLQKKAEILQDIAEKSKAKTDTLRKLSIAKSLAVQAIKLYQENTSADILNKTDKELPKILALQAFYLYKENNKDKKQKFTPDIIDALIKTSETTEIIKGKDSHSDAIRDIAISPDGNSILSCSNDGSIRLFINNKLSESKLIQGKNKVGVRTLAFSNDNNLFFAGDENGDISIWNLKDTKNYKTKIAAHLSIVTKIESNGNQLFSAGKDGYFKTWILNNGNFEISNTINFGVAITNFSLSPDKSKLLIVGNNGLIGIYNASTYQKIKDTVSPEGKILVAKWISETEFTLGYWSGKLEIRETNKIGETKISFFAHASGITAIELNVKKGILCTASYDGKVKIWQISDFEVEPAVLTNQNSWIYTLALNKNATKIISAGKDKSIQLTIIDAQMLEKEIRKTVKMNMSNKNWLKYIGKGIPYNENLPN